MASDEMDRLRRVFLAVLDLPADERARKLDEECGDDAGLRGEVEALLAASAPSFLGRIDETRGFTAGTAKATAMPESIGPYRVLGLLGSGGMGVVYRVEQQNPSRAVALKVLQAGLVTDERRRRFEREAQVLGTLQHPGIAQVYDAGTCDFGYGEMPYFAMELIEGEELTRYARSRSLDTAARCELIARIADAVQHAHDQGVVHRDLKPANILVTDNGPKVLDFGVARNLEADTVESLRTQTGQLVGTLPYMSPEQVSGQRGEIDERSDVYALGVLLYELLAGRVPLEVEGRSLTEVARVVERVDPTLLGRMDRALRGDLETICDKALAKEKGRRYASAAAFANDLRRFLADEPIAARPQTTWYQVRKFARRNRVLVGGAATTVLALVGGLIGTLIYAARADDTAAAFRRSLYHAEMRLAGSALRSPAGSARIRQILAAWKPRPGDTSEDPRGWEWYFLDAHAHSDHRIELPARFLGALSWESNREVMFTRLHSTRRTLNFYDLDTGQLREISVSNKNQPLPSPDRRLLASAGPNRFRLYDFATKEEVASWTVPQRPGRWAWHPNGELLAFALPHYEQGKPETGYVEVRKIPSGETVVRLPGNPRCDMDLAFSHDGRWLAADENRSFRGVTLFRSADWHRTRVLHTGDRVTKWAWHPSRATLAIGYVDGTVRGFVATTGETAFTLGGAEQPIRALEWNPDGTLLAIGTDAGAVHVWDPAKTQGRWIGSHNSRVIGLCWSPDGKRILTGGKSLRIWGIDTPQAMRTLVAASPKKRVCSPLAWHPDSRRLAVGLDGDTRIIDVRTGNVSQKIEGRRLSFGPRGEVLAFQRRDHVHVRAVGETTNRYSRDLGTEDCRALVWHPSEQRLALLPLSRCWVWNPATGDAVEDPREGHFRDLVWSPEGSLLWGIGYSSYVRVWNWRTQRTSELLEQGGMLAGAWNAAGTRFAIGTEHNTVQVWTRDAWAEHDALHGHFDGSQCLAWHPNGKRLASGSQDKTVRLWDVEHLREVIALEHATQIMSVAWSPNGEMLASISDDGCVKIWDAGANRHR